MLLLLLTILDKLLTTPFNHFSLYERNIFTGLHVLLCASAVVVRQVAPIVAVLPSSTWILHNNNLSLITILYCCTTEEPAVRGRLIECLETILNKCQDPPKSKKVQHSNAKNAVLFEAINLIIHIDRSIKIFLLSIFIFLKFCFN